METKLYKPLHVVPDALNENIQTIPSVIIEEDCQHDEHSKREADFTEATNPDLQAADDRSCSNSSDRPDDNYLVGNALFNQVLSSAELVRNASKSRVNLDGADS